MTRASELRELTDEELAQQLEAAQEEKFNLRFQLAMGKQDNSARLGHVRREVARLLTLQSERKGASAEAPASGRKSTTRKAAR
ncbi:MAG TPA: 50S ribosomal protein L29 [Acidimicrobiales bacterium]|nr:50S ribosomal protein L29 [Acidimicrobiales bacterium]